MYLRGKNDKSDYPTSGKGSAHPIDKPTTIHPLVKSLRQQTPGTSQRYMLYQGVSLYSCSYICKSTWNVMLLL